MAIDMQHTQGTNAYLTIRDVSNAPILDSHEWPVTGQSSVATITEVAQSGGGYGVIAPLFIAAWQAGPTVAHVAGTLRTLANIPNVGAEHIGLGGDYMPTTVAGTSYIPASVAELRTLTAAMLGPCNSSSGYHAQCFTEAETTNILGANLIRLYDRVWDPTRGRSGGLAHFYTCTNSSSSAECVAAKSHYGQGDFNHRPVSCLGSMSAGSVGLQLRYSQTANQWEYFTITSGLLYPCVNGTLLAVSFNDGTANGQLAMCPNTGGPSMCSSARLGNGAGSADTRAVNCLAHATSGPLGLQMAYTSSAFRWYYTDGSLNPCVATSALTTRWGVANGTARVKLCDDRASDPSDPTADSICVAAASNGGSGTANVRALNCYNSKPDAAKHGAVGLELVYQGGRWKYYEITNTARNCVHGSVMVAHW